ncbi:MAG: hypothetical protein ACPG31_05585 [Planctomycetota bacterium]
MRRKRLKPFLPDLTRALFLSVAVLPMACNGGAQNETNSEVAAPEWEPVLELRAASFIDDELPELSEEEVLEAIDLLDLSTLDANSYRRAMGQLDGKGAEWSTAAMLQIVEGRVAEPYLRSEAYMWLAAHGVEAMVPRLLLRLKYEKDWSANVDIAVALLRFDNGAGLDPLVTILRTEEGVPELDKARWAALAALEKLPPYPGWTPGESFGSDWERLVAVDEAWRLDRRLPGVAEAGPPSRALRAAVWKTLRKFRGQRLRPVDDARFALTRMHAWVFEPLVETASDVDPYVREHALQTLSWVGPPVGRWATEQGFDLHKQYAALLSDGRLRPRVLEAMGASGLAVMQDSILLWLREGNLEESTAAADALLRCADAQVQRPIEVLLNSDALLSPEGRWSLECLRAALQPGYQAVPPEGLDPSEKTRRERWAAERSH